MSFTSPTIQPGATPGAVGVAYDYVYTISPGSYGPPYTIALTAGALPPGLSVNLTTAEITGTPTTAGTYSYTLRVYANANPALTHDTPDTIVIATAPPPPSPCDEYGRETRAYVSGYQRSRIHQSRLVRGEQRCLCAEFSGAISPARTIASVAWYCQQPYAIVMSNARIVGTECAVTINAQAETWAILKCVATLDNGEVYTQLFGLTILSAPFFVGEAIPSSSGPTILTSP
jgi:hypothetical protein